MIGNLRIRIRIIRFRIRTAIDRNMKMEMKERDLPQRRAKRRRIRRPILIGKAI